MRAKEKCCKKGHATFVVLVVFAFAAARGRKLNVERLAGLGIGDKSTTSSSGKYKPRLRLNSWLVASHGHWQVEARLLSSEDTA